MLRKLRREHEYTREYSKNSRDVLVLLDEIDRLKAALEKNVSVLSRGVADALCDES